MNAEVWAYGFTAGMLAAVNPCGFALLPAYLSYYLGLSGQDGEQTSDGAGLLTALRVSAAMTVGFLAVFAPIGIVWSSISDVIGRHLPWVTIVLGVALVAVGIAMLRGYQPVVRLPKLDVGKGSQQFWSMYVFGVSYAIASLSCTIPVFAVVMTSTFSESFLTGLGSFVAYGAGMGAVVTVLTVAVAFAREGVVRSLRRLMPLTGRVSGGLLVIAGVFVVYSGWAELQIFAGRTKGTGAFSRLQEAQADIQNALDRVGALTLALVTAGVIATAVVTARLLRRRHHPDPSRPSTPPARTHSRR